MTRTIARCLLLPAVAAAMLLPATAAQAAPATSAAGCEVWLTGGPSAFARCLTNPGGYRAFRAVAYCPQNKVVTGPWVPFGETTWATCKTGNAYDVALDLLR